MYFRLSNRCLLLSLFLWYLVDLSLICDEQLGFYPSLSDTCNYLSLARVQPSPPYHNLRVLAPRAEVVASGRERPRGRCPRVTHESVEYMTFAKVPNLESSIVRGGQQEGPMGVEGHGVYHVVVGVVVLKESVGTVIEDLDLAVRATGGDTGAVGVELYV